MEIERISYRPENAARTRSVLLEQPTIVEIAGAACVTGDELDETGAPTGRVHVIASELITRRRPMRIDLHYGTLVPA